MGGCRCVSEGAGEWEGEWEGVGVCGRVRVSGRV